MPGKGRKSVARKKKPVDCTPICGAAYLRRIDPVWMPGRVPMYFWEDQTHRRDYLLWLADRLGFRTMEGFYGLTISVCKRNYGRGLLDYWGSSTLEAVRDCFPQYDWKPWLFTQVHSGFWDSPANLRSYMDWLGQRLGYRRSEDWYEITIHDFLRNRGGTLMNWHYRGSPASAVIDLVPAQEWCEWKFRRVPPGFWDAAENRWRYLRWLGREMGFRRTKDWYRIKARDLVRRHGKELLTRYPSFYDLMREFLPQLDWDRVDLHRTIRVEEVLAWADAHHARHGTWPGCTSGEIPGTGWTWLRIDVWMRTGSRGLPRGTSLAGLLKKRRGAAVGRWPRMREKRETKVVGDS